MKKRRTSISTKSNLQSILLVLITSTSVAIFSVYLGYKDNYSQLLRTGRTIAEMVALNSEYGIYTEDLESLKTLLDGAIQDADVCHAAVLDREKRVLVQRTLVEFKDVSFSEIGAEGTGNDQLVIDKVALGQTQEEYIRVLAPVISHASNAAIDPLSLGDPAPGQERTIGYVHLCLSQNNFREGMTTFLTSAALFTACFLLLAIGTNLYMTRRAVLPLRRLARVAKKVSEGDFWHEIKVDTNDEIGDLALAFDSMLKNLASKHGQIEDYQKSLEDKVKQRTWELETAVERARQLAEDAEAATRAKSQFLANMSHEIRTPLNGVMGMLELVSNTPMTEKASGFLATARRSSEALLRVINDILDFSKMEAGKLKLENTEFQLREVVEEAVALFAHEAHRKGLELICEIKQDVPASLRGDPVRLGQVIGNLVGNAVKFTETGEIVVRVSVVDDALETVHLRLEVVDTGVGISLDDQWQVFGKFIQADGSSTRKHGGTGLGLAISQQLCQMMGGQIGLESEPGKGSTFWFTARFERGSRSTRPSRSSGEALSNLRVLIVDDNETNREILHQLVLSWGMRNGSVGTGLEALERLRRAAGEGDPYDLVLLDYHMPGMDGLEVARTMEQDPTLRNSRRVILTSVDHSVDEVERSEAGISAWLTKPVRASMLYNCLVAAMQGSASEARNADPLPQPEDGFDATVLLAEDNPVNQEVALNLLENLGCRVETVGTGRDAVNATLRTKFDLILMDCQMPEMDGYEATGLIKENERIMCEERVSTPIIALTAHAMEGDREKCLAAGMDDYLAKPFTQEQLSEILKKWLKETTEVRRVASL